MASEGRFDGKSESLPRFTVAPGAGDAPQESLLILAIDSCQHLSLTSTTELLQERAKQYLCK